MGERNALAGQVAGAAVPAISPQQMAGRACITCGRSSGRLRSVGRRDGRRLVAHDGVCRDAALPGECGTCAELRAESRDPSTPEWEHVVARVRLTWHRIEVHRW